MKDYSAKRDLILLDELRNSQSEYSCLEFKENNSDPKVIGKLCSALSNSARIENEDFAYILWGISDSDHTVVGTDFDPDKQTVGNQVFQFWLTQMLNPKLVLSFRTISHPDGKVILLEIPATTTAPLEYDGTAYIRISSATPKLSQYPNHFQKLINNLRPYTWEKGIAKSFITDAEVLSLIDYPSYFKLLGQTLPDNKAGILERLESERLISKDVGEYWNITNMGAILFAVDLNEFESSISRKAVRFISYEGDNKASTVTHRHDGIKGYASGFSGLIQYIHALLPQNEYIGDAFRKEETLFPKIAIRELVANALIHQNMTISGAGPQIELFVGRMEITNPGQPLIKIDRMIDLPPRSRNEMLATLMRRMGICEEQGTGLDKVILSVELYQLPAPKFQADHTSMQVILYAPRPFGKMTANERIRACYQHTVIRYLSDKKMTNSSLCERFGLERKNSAQASIVIKGALKEKKIRYADPERPRGGYVPRWV